VGNNSEIKRHSAPPFIESKIDANEIIFGKLNANAPTSNPNANSTNYDYFQKYLGFT